MSKDISVNNNKKYYVHGHSNSSKLKKVKEKNTGVFRLGQELLVY
jgi:hypothetical protein